MSSNEYAKQDNQAVSNVDEFIIEAPEEDPNFDKLSNLVTVLENDIRKAHNNSISIEKVIMSIRNSAYESENSPMAEHVSLLYCHIAEENKAQQRAAAAAASSKTASTLNYQEQEEDDMYADTINLTGEIPFYLYSGSSKQIIGWEVLNRNVFYSRAATALFCFVAFVVMSCVPNVGHRKVNPNYYLEVIFTRPCVCLWCKCCVNVSIFIFFATIQIRTGGLYIQGLLHWSFQLRVLPVHHCSMCNNLLAQCSLDRVLYPSCGHSASQICAR